MQSRIDYYTKRTKKRSTRHVYKAKRNVCVFKENDNYVILGGNCTSYSAIKVGFKRIKVRVFKPKASEFWIARRFYKGKQIRKKINEIIILKNSYDYHENTRKLLWLALKLSLYLLRHKSVTITTENVQSRYLPYQIPLSLEDYNYEGCIIDISKSKFIIPKHYVFHGNRQDEPLILVKTQENAYHVIDGVERLTTYKQANKNKIEAWIFTIHPQYSNMEAWAENISHEFNMTWNV